MLRALAIAVFTALPALAHAESGLGLRTLSFGASGGDEVRSAEIIADVAVTRWHGLQLDLEADARDDTLIAAIGLHGYMTPRAGQKYGLYARIADVDDAAIGYWTAGAEGRFAIGDRSSLALHAGIGAQHIGDGPDFVHAGASFDHALSEGTRVFLQTDLAHFEEEGFNAFGLTTQAGIETRIGGGPLHVGLQVRQDRLDGYETQQSLGLSLRYELGTARTADPAHLPFRAAGPLDQFVRRGIATE